MKEPKRQPAESKAAMRVKPHADRHVERTDLELADGRYLLVYSRQPRA